MEKSSLIRNEKFKLELVWKKGKLKVGGEHRFVKFHNGNIFHISYENKIENCVEMFDLEGNLKWRYVCEKGEIAGWSFLENMLFVCWNNRDPSGYPLDSGIIAMDYNGKIKYEYNARDIEKDLWIKSMFSDGKYLAVWGSNSLVCLLDIHENELKLRWKHDCNEEINDPEWATVWDVKICGEKVIVVSESYIYWFDINGNIKNKIEDCYEHCEIIKNVVICSGPSIPITAYYLDSGNLAWEFDVLEFNKAIGYESFFTNHGFKHTDYFIIPGFSYILGRNEDEEAQTVYIFNPEGKLVNKIFVEDKFKEKLPNPNVQKTIWCLSADDKYLGVGTYDGYFYLFTLKGELLSVWHNWTTRVKQITRGKPIESLDLENDYVVISYKKEFVLLKITKI